MQFLEKVWPQQTCTAMIFMIPKKFTSERPLALMPTLIRWWEALRAPGVTKWQQKCRMDWDATDGRNGGAQQTVLEILMEMGRFHGKAKEEHQGAVALVLHLAKAFELVSFLVVWVWATHFSFPRMILRVLCGHFEARTVRRMPGGAAPDHVGHLTRVQVELFASADCIAGCVE